VKSCERGEGKRRVNMVLGKSGKHKENVERKTI